MTAFRKDPVISPSRPTAIHETSAREAEAVLFN
jgi:hypothetical protein